MKGRKKAVCLSSPKAYIQVFKYIQVYNDEILCHTDQVHSVPVQQMGNYQDYLKKQPAPLRELETSPARLHTFGNPFKVKVRPKKKKQNIFCARILLVFENYTSIFEESKTDDLKALYYKHMIIRMEGNK